MGVASRRLEGGGEFFPVLSRRFRFPPNIKDGRVFCRSARSFAQGVGKFFVLSRPATANLIALSFLLHSVPSDPGGDFFQFCPVASGFVVRCFPQFNCCAKTPVTPAAAEFTKTCSTRLLPSCSTLSSSTLSRLTGGGIFLLHRRVPQRRRVPWRGPAGRRSARDQATAAKSLSAPLKAHHVRGDSFESTSIVPDLRRQSIPVYQIPGNNVAARPPRAAAIRR